MLALTHKQHLCSPLPHLPMSTPAYCATHSTHAIRDALHEGDSFQKFFECWIVEQNQHLEELVSASKEEEERRRLHGHPKDQREAEEQALRPLVERVVRHYEHYYQAKAQWGKTDVLSMFNPSWRSNLEDAFLWIGGWRPSMAFHLLYSESGLQLESRLHELMQGISIGDLSDLSPTQLEKVDRLQMETIQKEQEVSEKLAEQQETVADSSMVALAHAMTAEVDVDEGRVDSTLAPKQDGLVRVLHMADDLRLQTLTKVIDILTPMQAVHYLIAAAVLHLRIHEWGKKRDARLAQNANNTRR